MEVEADMPPAPTEHRLSFPVPDLASSLMAVVDRNIGANCKTRNASQAYSAARLVYGYTPANRGRVRVHDSRRGKHVSLPHAMGKTASACWAPDGQEHSAEAEKTLFLCYCRGPPV